MPRLVTSVFLVTVVWTTLSASPPPATRAAPTTGEVRALWVVRDSLTSPEAVDRLVARAAAGGFDTLLVQVRGRGDAYFLGGIEPRAELLDATPAFDPLAAILVEARRAGLRVHAWVNLNLVASATYLPASPDHIVHRQPGWLMVPRALARELGGPPGQDHVARLARWTRAQSGVEGLYLSPIAPGAAAHTTAVLVDLVTRYAVDGIHFDYVRYPGPDFDYSPLALAEFAAAMATRVAAADRARLSARARLDALAWTDAYPVEWSDFRRSRLTALVMRLRTALRAARPEVMISAAVAPDLREAFETRFQDARTWAEAGLIDVLCPMAYDADGDVFRRQVEEAVRVTSPAQVWAGIGAYRLAPGDTVARIDTARTAGAHGVALFSYDTITAGGEAYLRAVRRGAFATPAE
jgi:uncharacterized lipoprotein YddW (UPF0748 family)